MLAHSAEFAAAVYEPFTRVISRVDVLAGGVPVLVGIPATAEVTADRSQFSRRTVSLTLPGRYVDDTGVERVLAPDGAVGDLMAPFGNELRVHLGFELPSGEQELLCQGTFVIWDADVDEVGDVSVSGYDRAKLLADYRFPYPRHVRAGTSAKNLLIELLSVVPRARVVFRGAIDDVALPDQTFQEDRDAAVQLIATALGCEVFCDVWGDFVIQPIPDPYADPVLTMSEDDLLITGRRTLSRDGVKNAVVARGQSTGDEPTPISRLVKDEVKSSPTYSGGPFGLVVGFIDNSAITSDRQADVVAGAAFRDLIGAVKSVDFSAVPYYALEPGDPVRVDVYDGAEQHLLDQLRMSTDETALMSGSTRAVTSSEVK